MRDRTDLRWNGRALHLGHHTKPLLTVVPDDRWSGIYRIRFRDRHLSDMVNLTRAKDAAEGIALSDINPKGSIRAVERPPVRLPRRGLSDIGEASVRNGGVVS